MATLDFEEKINQIEDKINFYYIWGGVKCILKYY